MRKPEFVYVTYIETTPEKLWEALTEGDFTERYWFGWRFASEAKVGASYTFTKPGAEGAEGKLLEFDPPRQLAYTWHLCTVEAKSEPSSRVAFDLEPRGKAVKLTVTHDGFGDGSITQRDISGGWPIVLSGLKSLLETGQVLTIDPISKPCR